MRGSLDQTGAEGEFSLWLAAAGDAGDYADLRPLPQALGDIVYRAMVDTISVPENDNYIIVTEHAPARMHVTKSYPGVTYPADIHARLKIRRDDVFITLSWIRRDDVSFVSGEAQYAS